MQLWMVICSVPFLGHCDFDLVSRIIVSGAYLLYCLRYEFQIWFVDSSWDVGVVNTILSHFDIDFYYFRSLQTLTSDLISGEYLIYYK